MSKPIVKPLSVDEYAAALTSLWNPAKHTQYRTSIAISQSVGSLDPTSYMYLETLSGTLLRVFDQWATIVPQSMLEWISAFTFLLFAIQYDYEHKRLPIDMWNYIHANQLSDRRLARYISQYKQIGWTVQSIQTVMEDVADFATCSIYQLNKTYYNAFKEIIRDLDTLRDVGNAAAELRIKSQEAKYSIPPATEESVSEFVNAIRQKYAILNPMFQHIDPIVKAETLEIQRYIWVALNELLYRNDWIKANSVRNPELTAYLNHVQYNPNVWIQQMLDTHGTDDIVYLLEQHSLSNQNLLSNGIPVKAQAVHLFKSLFKEAFGDTHSFVGISTDAMSAPPRFESTLNHPSIMNTVDTTNDATLRYPDVSLETVSQRDLPTSFKTAVIPNRTPETSVPSSTPVTSTSAPPPAVPATSVPLTSVDASMPRVPDAKIAIVRPHT